MFFEGCEMHFFFLKRTISTLQLKRIISDTLCLTGAGVSVGASGFCCELRLLPNKKKKLEEAWVLLPPFTAMLVMFDYKKVPNLGPGHCLDSKGFPCISFSDLHFLIKFVLLLQRSQAKLYAMLSKKECFHSTEFCLKAMLLT